MWSLACHLPTHLTSVLRSHRNMCYCISNGCTVTFCSCCCAGLVPCSCVSSSCETPESFDYRVFMQYPHLLSLSPTLVSILTWYQDRMLHCNPFPLLVQAKYDWDLYVFEKIVEMAYSSEIIAGVWRKKTEKKYAFREDNYPNFKTYGK